MDSYFRIVVDMSSFFEDARRTAYVFVDLMKIRTIQDLQLHIMKLFTLNQPLHLLSSGKKYLHPSEDVRILQNNETAIVLPGVGFSNGTISETTVTLEKLNSTHEKSQIKKTNETSTFAMANSQNASTLIKSEIPSVAIAKTDESTHDLSPQANQTMYVTVRDNFTTSFEESNPKISDSVLTDNKSINEDEEDGSNKQGYRKRVRRRKREKNNVEKENDTKMDKKPKIVSDIPIPAGKHIRFNTLDNEEFTKTIESEDETRMKNGGNALVSKNLSTLLGLRQTSTPLIFPKKVHQKSKTDVPQNQNENSVQRVKNENKNLNIGDIIEFTKLKMTENYNPEVSAPITAEVVSFKTETSQYELRIISGKEEIEVPIGKFSLPEEETNPESNVVYLAHSDFVQIKVVKEANSQ